MTPCKSCKGKPELVNGRDPKSGVVYHEFYYRCCDCGAMVITGMSTMNGKEQVLGYITEGNARNAWERRNEP